MSPGLTWSSSWTRGRSRAARWALTAASSLRICWLTSGSSCPSDRRLCKSLPRWARTSMVLSGYGIEAIHPDESIVRLWDEKTASVLAAAKLHRASLKKPPKTAAKYLATLELCRLAEAVARLRSYERG